jgi:PhnB protein
MNLEVYLYFKGNCREAMEFYKKVFGGQLDVSSYADVPGTDPAHKDWLMHASLHDGDISLMASDTPEASERAAKIELALVGTDDAKLRKAFEALAEGGKILMPLEKQSWGDVYGKVADKYGIDWAFNIGTAGQ